jgi:hypothetical protein
VATSTKSNSTSAGTNASSNGGGGPDAGTIARGAIGVVAGAAALGLAAAAAVKHARQPRVLGIRVPRALTPGKFDLKRVAKQIGDIAERVEHTSEDVRVASAQAKRVSKKLG